MGLRWAWGGGRDLGGRGGVDLGEAGQELRRARRRPDLREGGFDLREGGEGGGRRGRGWGGDENRG